MCYVYEHLLLLDYFVPRFTLYLLDLILTGIIGTNNSKRSLLIAGLFSVSYVFLQKNELIYVKFLYDSNKIHAF